MSEVASRRRAAINSASVRFSLARSSGLPEKGIIEAPVAWRNIQKLAAVRAKGNSADFQTRKLAAPDLYPSREVGADVVLANPVRSGRKQP